MSSEHAISSVMVLNVIVAVLKDEETPLKRNLFSLKGSMQIRLRGVTFSSCAVVYFQRSVCTGKSMCKV